MPRELNPDVFGNVRPPAWNENSETAQAFEASSDSLKKRVRELESAVESLQQKIQQMNSAFEQRLQHHSSVQKNFETHVKMQFQEQAQNQAHVFSKMNERKASDAKIQEMIDRHNSLVQSFEVRLAAAQKINSEQEMKIRTYQSTLDEILREVKRRQI